MDMVVCIIGRLTLSVAFTWVVVGSSTIRSNPDTSAPSSTDTTNTTANMETAAVRIRTIRRQRVRSNYLEILKRRMLASMGFSAVPTGIYPNLSADAIQAAWTQRNITAQSSASGQPRIILRIGDQETLTITDILGNTTQRQRYRFKNCYPHSCPPRQQQLADLWQTQYTQTLKLYFPVPSIRHRSSHCSVNNATLYLPISPTNNCTSATSARHGQLSRILISVYQLLSRLKRNRPGDTSA